MKNKIIIAAILFILLIIVNIFYISKVRGIEEKLRLQSEEKIMKVIDFKTKSLIKFIEENIGKVNEQIGVINKNLQDVKDTVIRHEGEISIQKRQDAELFQKIEGTLKSQNERLMVLESKNKIIEVPDKKSLQQKK